MKTVYNVNNKKSVLKCDLFLDEQNDGVTIARYDQLRYPRIEKFTEKQISFFWRPEEVNITVDKADFMSLTEGQKHIFTSNLKRQILLDSVQGRSPNLVFLPICTSPELEVWLETWGFSETIHSRSYTHIIRNIYPDPSVVFDEINSIDEIVKCANDVTRYYDSLMHYNNEVFMEGYNNERTRYEHKRRIWLALMAANILEGVRFYISFACSWAFAEQKKMEGNAKIIKFICRDENLHLGSTKYLLTELAKSDPDFKKIKKETRKECIEMFKEAVQQEKDWAAFLFKHGSMIGLNEELLCEYIEWIACKRMKSVGLPAVYDVSTDNPLPWTESWIAGKERQVAPQEVQISSYLIGEIDKSIDDTFFDDIKL